MLSTFRKLFATPITTPQHWGVIVLVALAFIFAPQFDYNDWERNTDGLTEGVNIYDNPNAVYPPWGLALLWPYYLLTSAGSRVVSVLVVGWLAARNKWSLLRFFMIVLSPFFIWTMLLSNIDLLALLLPVVLWEAVERTRWQTIGRGAALAILLIKPQGSFLLITYWLWTHRDRWRDLVIPVGLVLCIIVPTSLIGDPPLWSQWIDNLQHPSEDNQEFWDINNISLTDAVGPVLAVLVVGASIGGLYVLRRWRGQTWTQNYTYAALLLSAMLISPYTSNQSVIVPLAFVPSLPAVIIQYVTIFAGSALKIYRDYDPAWTLVLGLIALWLYRPAHDSEIVSE